MVELCFSDSVKGGLHLALRGFRGTIGGAVSSTNIQVAGRVDLSPLLLVLAAVGLVGAVWFAWRLLRRWKG